MSWATFGWPFSYPKSGEIPVNFYEQIMLYFSTVVCALYLVSGGYKVIRNYIQKKIDEAAAAKAAG